ncbi:glycosyltransferase [uncultured Cellulomonas sp.]|uniref:glycosyltransferase family 2 protein n=1 Tax=uncultured Cellulomonas sp. TaxID=189682 RepID=UPI0028E3F68D|nr:glycosyltransferase [uncultured Cellulomonas sp.]
MTALISLLIADPDLDSAALSRTLASVRRQGTVRCDVLVARPRTVGDDAEPVPHGHDVRVMLVDLGSTPAADRTALLLQTALSAARTTYAGVLAPGDELEPGALAACLHLLRARPVDVLYTDEQYAGPGGGIVTKPGWSSHYLESYPYLGRLCLVRTELLRDADAFAPGHPGLEEWDAALRVTERTASVAHLPVIAVTRPSAPSGGSERVAVATVTEHLERSGAPGWVEAAASAPGVVVWRSVGDQPLVSIVVPTAGTVRDVHGESRRLVTNALTSVRDRTTYPHWEVVVVTGDNTAPEVEDELSALLGDRVRFTRLDGPFNFSRAINEGARLARGELLLLLNDDTEVIEPRWLERMVSVIQDPGVGAVGAKLVLENGLIQHVGVVMGEHLVPQHPFVFEQDVDDRAGAKTLDRDYIAVTGACLLTRLDLFTQVGGLTEALPLNFNDVDYCLKVGAAGYAVVATPFAVLAHYESSTRTPQLTAHDQAFLERHWTLRLAADPHIAFRSDR